MDMIVDVYIFLGIEFLLRVGDIEDERNRMHNNGNPVALLPQADALAYGMTTALRRGFNGKKPRVRSVASQCVSIMPDGSRTIFTPARATTKNVAGITRRTSTRQVGRDILLQAAMGTIHTEA